jgi:hypothetical protein
LLCALAPPAAIIMPTAATPIMRTDFIAIPEFPANIMGQLPLEANRMPEAI